MVVCMPEAAAVMSDYAETPEDNVVFSQGLGGNSTVYLLYPEEHIHGTWSALFLHLKYKTNSICIKTLYMQPVSTSFVSSTVLL